MDSVLKKLKSQAEHEEFSKDAGGFFGSIGNFLGGVGSTISNAAGTFTRKTGLDGPLNAIAENEYVKGVSNAAKTVAEGAGNIVKSGVDKVMETTVAKNAVQSAEHSYVALKNKIKGNEGNQANQGNPNQTFVPQSPNPNI